VRRDTSSFQPPNTVLHQSPAAGTRLSPGGAVTLTVSYFPPEKSADSAPRALPDSLPPARPAADTTRPARRRPLPPIIPTDSGAPVQPVKPAMPPAPPTTPRTY
jgi:beta-lactam-binding protein with PASTA domain